MNMAIPMPTCIRLYIKSILNYTFSDESKKYNFSLSDYNIFLEYANVNGGVLADVWCDDNHNLVKISKGELIIR
jgi:hypothetical protein